MTTNYHNPAEPLDLKTLGDLKPLRQALANAGYSPAHIAATLDLKNPSESIDLPVLMRRTSAPGDFNTLVRLFMLGQPVSELQVRQAVLPMSLETLLAGGLLVADSRGISSVIKLIPHDEMVFASDFTYPARTEPLAGDHVLGVGPASITLSVMTVRAQVDSVLDVGCGAGIQAILCSRHARNVIGTDISQRALNFAAFNARFNGIENIQWRQGSFFEPAAGELFELVVANPPYVISPESGFMYRDSGMGGDAVSEHIVKGAAAKLKEGGFATVLVNWHHQNEDDWEQRPRGWVEALGCDCWLVRSGISKPLAYAASWLRFNESRNPERYGRLLDEWMAYYERLGIGLISAGTVILRKRSGTHNWVRCDTADNVNGSGRCSDSIQRVFAAEDFLQDREEDSRLLDQQLIIHPAVTALQKLVVGKDGWSVESLNLNMSEGFPFSGKADIHILQLLANCDGKRNVRAAIQALADAMGSTFENLAPSCQVVIKKMLRSGMLIFKE